MADSYPRITRGLGKLTPSLWGRIMDALRFVEQEGPNLQRIGVDVDRFGRPAARASTILLVIDAAAPIAVNRWRYSWSEGRFDIVSQTYFRKTDGVTSSTPGWGSAYSPVESFNSSTVVNYGVFTSSPIASVEPRPFPVDAVMLAHVITSANGNGDPVRVPHLIGMNALSVACAQ